MHVTAVSATTVYTGPVRRTGNSATSRGNILPATTTYLMAEYAADNRAQNRSWHIGVAAITYAFTVDPATLLGLP